MRTVWGVASAVFHPARDFPAVGQEWLLDAALWLLTVRVGLRGDSDPGWQVYFLDGEVESADRVGARVVGEAFNASLGRTMRVTTLPAAQSFTEAAAQFAGVNRGASAALVRRSVRVWTASPRRGAGPSALWVRSATGVTEGVGAPAAVSVGGAGSVELDAELVYAVPADPGQETLVLLQLLVPVRRLVHFPLIPPAVVAQLMRFGFDGPRDAQFLPLVFPFGQLSDADPTGVPVVPSLRWLMQASGEGPMEESGLPPESVRLLAACVLVEALVAQPALIAQVLRARTQPVSAEPDVPVGNEPSRHVVGDDGPGSEALVGELVRLSRARTWPEVVGLVETCGEPVGASVGSEVAVAGRRDQSKATAVAGGRLCGGDAHVWGPMVLSQTSSPSVLAAAARGLELDQRRALMLLLGTEPELGRWFTGTDLDPARLTARDAERTLSTAPELPRPGWVLRLRRRGRRTAS